MGIIESILISFIMMVAAYLIMPKPKMPKATAKDMDEPTASAGSPIKVVYGTVTIKDPNILWFGDKETHTFKTK